MREVNIPVLIVGGGGCGLSLSIFLSTSASNTGCSSVGRARRASPKPTTSISARWRSSASTVSSTRPRWKCSHRKDGCGPVEDVAGRGWAAGPLGVPGDGSFGGGSLRPRYEADGPVLSGNLPQVRLEPLLRQQAELRAPDSVLFNHTVTEIDQDGDGVTALVSDNATGETFRVRAQYAHRRRRRPPRRAHLRGDDAGADRTAGHGWRALQRRPVTVVGRQDAPNLLQQSGGCRHLGQWSHGGPGADLGQNVRRVGDPVRFPPRRSGPHRRGGHGPPDQGTAEAARPRTARARHQSLGPGGGVGRQVSSRPGFHRRGRRAPTIRLPPGWVSIPPSRIPTTWPGNSPWYSNMAYRPLCWIPTSPNGCPSVAATWSRAVRFS